ncbi:MAG: hypothetical protein ACK5PG_05050 [Lysobacterales bacterium]
MSTSSALIPLLAAVLIAMPVHAEEAPDKEDPARYRVSATVEPRLSSVDGRYGVAAALRVAPSLQSADGRFRLKTAAASCDPADARLFANGFEAL